MTISSNPPAPSAALAGLVNIMGKATVTNLPHLRTQETVTLETEFALGPPDVPNRGVVRGLLVFQSPSKRQLRGLESNNRIDAVLGALISFGKPRLSTSSPLTDTTGYAFSGNIHNFFLGTAFGTKNPSINMTGEIQAYDAKADTLLINPLVTESTCLDNKFETPDPLQAVCHYNLPPVQSCTPPQRQPVSKDVCVSIGGPLFSVDDGLFHVEIQCLTVLFES